MPGRIYDATWGRLFAALYDRFIASTEEAGLRDERRELLAGAAGRTLEVGAGTGLNLDHYPPSVTELTLAEPDPHMVKRLRRRLVESARTASVVEAPGERLPFEDGTFDSVVVTLVLCTVEDPAATVAEIARVLRPGGKLLFLEHVRADDPRLARWQDRLHGVWTYVGDGCNCNRDTLATLRASALQVDAARHGELPKAPPIVRPLISGSASLPG